MATAGAAGAQSGKPPAAPPAVQQEFDAFLTRFRAALKANDAAAVAGLTRLPFMADPAIADAAQFRAKSYATLFPARARACLQRARPVYDRDGEQNHTYSAFCGQTIFTFTKTPAGFRFTDVGAND
ncbi:MAG: hypothetical protein JNK46_04415 [Methylobacteriaceae bacterium]|nr:hypothetical protein [Methylobacteriaceae bacterium]